MALSPVRMCPMVRIRGGLVKPRRRGRGAMYIGSWFGLHLDIPAKLHARGPRAPQQPRRDALDRRSRERAVARRAEERAAPVERVQDEPAGTTEGRLEDRGASPREQAETPQQPSRGDRAEADPE